MANKGISHDKLPISTCARLWSMNTRTSDSWSYDPHRYLITYPHYGPSFLAVLAGLNFQFLHTTFPTYNFVGFGDLLGFAKLKPSTILVGYYLLGALKMALYNPPRGWVVWPNQGPNWSLLTSTNPLIDWRLEKGSVQLSLPATAI